MLVFYFLFLKISTEAVAMMATVTMKVTYAIVGVEDAAAGVTGVRLDEVCACKDETDAVAALPDEGIRRASPKQ